MNPTCIKFSYVDEIKGQLELSLKDCETLSQAVNEVYVCWILLFAQIHYVMPMTEPHYQ